MFIGLSEVIAEFNVYMLCEVFNEFDVYWFV